MSSAPARTVVSATLRVDGIELPGVLDTSASWTFAPTTRLDRRERTILSRALDAVIAWGENESRRETDVEVTDFAGEEISLRMRGKERRVQRRKAVRARMTQPCRVLTNSSEQVSSLAAETIDISATGVAVIFLRDSHVGGRVPIPRDGQTVGLLIDLESQRVGAVAQVMGHRRTEAGRVVLRLRFDQIRRQDSDTIQRAVLKYERSRIA